MGGSASSGEDDSKLSMELSVSGSEMEMSNVEREAEEREPAWMSSAARKELRRERFVSMSESLRELQSEFGRVYAAPKMVDLSAMSQKGGSSSYAQSTIGRNMRLRELKRECSRLDRECKQIESNFDEVDVSERRRERKVPLGRIEIASGSLLKSMGSKPRAESGKQTKV